MSGEQKTRDVVSGAPTSGILATSEAFTTDGAGSAGASASKPAPKQPRGAKAQQRASEKERITAERMAPRPCRYPPCGQMFTPKRVQDWKSEFCCKEHQQTFWIEANRLSAEALKSGNLGLLAPESEFRVGVSHSEQVLAILLRRAGEWVGDLPKLLPGVNMNVISKLRQAGWNIEAREVGERPFSVSHEYRPNWRRFLPGGRVEYQYRLVKGESE